MMNDYTKEIETQLELQKQVNAQMATLISTLKKYKNEQEAYELLELILEDMTIGGNAKAEDFEAAIVEVLREANRQ